MGKEEYVERWAVLDIWVQDGRQARAPPPGHIGALPSCTTPSWLYFSAKSIKEPSILIRTSSRVSNNKLYTIHILRQDSTCLRDPAQAAFETRSFLHYP